MSDSEPSRFVSRSVPSDELLPTIIEEANLDDDGIFGIEHLLLTSAELEPEVLLSLCLVLGRCGWNRSEGTLRQMERKYQNSGKEIDAHVVRLALALLDESPGAQNVEQADEGYRFSESGSPTLFVSDPIAAHWHRQGRWGPPIRPRFDAPVVTLEWPFEVSRTTELILDGRIVEISRDDSYCALTRAWFRMGANSLSRIRWNRVRSLGRIRSTKTQTEHLALEVEGSPIIQVPVFTDDIDLTEELFRRVLNRIKNGTDQR